MKQEMMRWQWHQLDYMQIICTFLQTDNHASTSSFNFFTVRMSDAQPTVSAHCRIVLMTLNDHHSDVKVVPHAAQWVV